MSGGYFDYAQASVADEFDGQWHDAELDDLFHDLFVAPIGDGHRAGGLAEALDLWLSDDWSEADYRREVAKFKQKWFKASRSKRLEGYVDQRCDELKAELHAMLHDDEEAA